MGPKSIGVIGASSHGFQIRVQRFCGLSGVQDIDGDFLHSLALKNDGTVWAWGRNQDGELGNSTNTSSNTPVQVSSLSGVQAIAAVANYSLALKNDGTVWAWGGNVYGQLGNGTQDNDAHTIPVQVSGLSDVQAIAAGAHHSLALKDDGTVWGWGNNYYGQLGNSVGQGDDAHSPVKVNGLSDVQAIAGGGNHSLALPSPTGPQTKADCKNGGWKDFGFKNNGQCIKAVTHATPADTTAPQTTLDQIDTSNLATNGSVVTHFSSSESNSTFECKMVPMNELGEELNNPHWQQCSSLETYEDLGWYSYRFYVRATDAAGNVDETPATQVFDAKVDSIPPDGEITDGPADGAVLNQSSVTYSFQVSDNREIQNTGCVVYDNATGFPYRLPTDDPNGLPSGEKRVCNSPVTFENIPDGNYTFTLYPQDKTYTDPTPATRTFTVDTTVP